jgi:hypothetical protein
MTTSTKAGLAISTRYWLINLLFRCRGGSGLIIVGSDWAHALYISLRLLQKEEFIEKVKLKSGSGSTK